MNQINIEYSNNFRRNFKSLSKAQKTLKVDFTSAIRLIKAHFFDNKQVLTPGRLRPIQDCSKVGSGYDVWRLEIVVQNLKANLQPRVWFVIHSEGIYFLEIQLHNRNFKANRVNERVTKEAAGIFGN